MFDNESPRMQKVRSLPLRIHEIAQVPSLAPAVGLCLERPEVLRSFRNTIDCLEETGAARVSARRCSLKGRERAIVSQTNTGITSMPTLGTPLTDGMERMWAFPGTYSNTGTVSKPTLEKRLRQDMQRMWAFPST